VTPARRRAAGLVLLAVVVATACTFLGRWQWHRHVARDAKIAVVEANWAATPAPLADLIPATGTVLDAGLEWRSAQVSGRYTPDATVLLRNRPVDGTPAYHVLVPLVVAGSGDVLVVDRGWVPVGADPAVLPEIPAPPAGDVDVVVRLRVAERPSDRAAPEGQVQAIDVGQVLAAAGGAAPEGDAYGFYGGLVSESPAPATTLGALREPDTDPGPHLSYAFQWWVFALGALGGFGWMARRELVEEKGSPAPSSAPPVRPHGRRQGRDEAVEDALVDAQLGSAVGGTNEPEANAQASATRSR
jgi:cytochrome oxidase assembly protein ShyY1